MFGYLCNALTFAYRVLVPPTFACLGALAALDGMPPRLIFGVVLIASALVNFPVELVNIWRRPDEEPAR